MLLFHTQIKISKEQNKKLKTMNKISELLEKSKKQTQSLLVSNLGTKKESIYKEELFAELSDKDKKKARKRIRNYVHAIFESVLQADKNNKKDNVKKLANEFSEFYKETYKINDYSFASVASENTKDKETINNALSIIKRELKIK